MIARDPSRRSEHLAWWAPAVWAGVFLILFTGGFWLQAELSFRERQKGLRHSAEAIAEALRNRLALSRSALGALGDALGKGLADEAGVRGGIRRLLEDHQELLGVCWLDEGLAERWRECRPSVAASGDEQGLPVASDEWLSRWRPSRSIQYSRARSVSFGVSAFDVFVPVYRDDAFLGVLRGVYSCDDLLQEALDGSRNALTEPYRVSLTNVDGLLAGRDRDEEVSGRLVQEAALDPPGHDTVLTLSHESRTPWNRSTVFFMLVSVALAVGMLSSVWAMRRQLRWRVQAEAELRAGRDALEARIAQRTADLSAANQRLSEDVAERVRMEEMLRRRADDLDKRIQEMRCLFAVSDLVEQPDASLEDIVQGTVEMIPPASQRPGQTAARVILDGRHFTTAAFRETPCRRSSDIVVRGETAGIVEVCYLGEVDPDGPAPFLPQEQHLLDVIAERLARVVERMRADRDQAALQEQLHQAQKMEAIGQLAAGVAHDFRNVLTVVRGHAHQAAGLLPPVHPAQEAVQLIQQAAAQANELTQSLLTFSQRAPTQRQRLDLGVAVHEWSRLLQYMLPRSIQLEVSLPGVPAWIEADPAQLQQVLMNLVINARDAMPDGGVLEVSVTREGDAAGAGQENSGDPDGPVVRLIVCDTGTGIPAELRARVFEPFFTTKPRGRGTGLGLSIAHGIVRDHDGRIDLQSEPGRGTMMVVSLPGQSPDTEEVAAVCPIRRQARGECILLVAENPYVRGLMALTLQSAGYSVIQAPDGRAGLRVWREKRNEIHLVIVDDEHAGADGILRALREDGDGTPVLHVVAGRDVTPPTGAGSSFCLRKPFEMPTLVEAVVDALEAESGERDPR